MLQADGRVSREVGATRERPRAAGGDVGAVDIRTGLFVADLLARLGVPDRLRRDHHHEDDGHEAESHEGRKLLHERDQRAEQHRHASRRTVTCRHVRYLNATCANRKSATPP